MDLRTFAIAQSLNGDSQLLKSVVEDRPLTIDEIETVFGGILADQKSPEADKFLADPQDYLMHTSKIQFTKSGESGAYQIDGEVDDDALNTLCLNEDVEPEKAVKSVITNVLGDLDERHQMKIADIELHPEESKVNGQQNHPSKPVQAKTKTETSALDKPDVQETHEQTKDGEKVVTSNQIDADEDAKTAAQIKDDEKVVTTGKTQQAATETEVEKVTESKVPVQKSDNETTQKVEELNDASKALSTDDEGLDGIDIDGIVSDSVLPEVVDGEPDLPNEIDDIPDDVSDDVPDDQLAQDDSQDEATSESESTGESVEDDDLANADQIVKPLDDVTTIKPELPVLQQPSKAEVKRATGKRELKVLKEAMNYLSDLIKEKELDKRLGVNTKPLEV